MKLQAKHNKKQVSIFTHSKVMAIWNGEKNVLVNVPVWQLF